MQCNINLSESPPLKHMPNSTSEQIIGFKTRLAAEQDHVLDSICLFSSEVADELSVLGV